MWKRIKSPAVLVAILAIVLATGYVVRAYQGTAPKVVVEGDYIEAPTTIVQAPGEETLGAFAGPDVYVPYLNINGIERTYEATRTRSATTTVCAIRSPRYATSTLSFASVHFDNVATSTNTVISVSKAKSPYATTTLLFNEWTNTASAGSSRATNATSTLTSVDHLVFIPGDYIVVGVKGVSAGQLATENVNGYCQAEFTILNK